MTVSDVLELLDPADPDSLQEFAPGVWTAKWSPLGVPELERIVIDNHDGIEIVRSWYEPKHLPHWQAVDFRVVDGVTA